MRGRLYILYQCITGKTRSIDELAVSSILFKGGTNQGFKVTRSRIKRISDLRFNNPAGYSIGIKVGASCWLISRVLSRNWNSIYIMILHVGVTHTGLYFQSLYPSVMIAYNYCYSTCLGRVGTFKGTRKFGVLNLELQEGLLWLLRDHINGKSINQKAISGL